MSVFFPISKKNESNFKKTHLYSKTGRTLRVQTNVFSRAVAHHFPAYTTSLVGSPARYRCV